MRKAKNTRDLTRPKEKIIKLPISKFIDTKFRDYAIYVLEQRGIPNFYDALTPVQRFIVKNAGNSFNKTLTLVGRAIQDGYHHGDQSLISAINKLARPFGNSIAILEGSGFFGTEVSPSPAAARYTSVKLSNVANGIINKYSYLTSREPEGPYDPLYMDIPIGLVSPIVGIAVGYKSTILPRKIKDIQDFIDGKRKSLKPHFEGFNGTVEKYKGLLNTWVIASKIEIIDKKILIREIPPILKYETVLKRLDHLFGKYEGNIRIVNNSNKTIDIDVHYIGKNKDEWDEIKTFIQKTFTVLVTENIVFVKDGAALVYDSIEQYLEDYKWQIANLKCKHLSYECNRLDFDLKFNILKEMFIGFILQKKRTINEIDNWLKDNCDQKDISERLERLTSRKFTNDEIINTKKAIIDLTALLKSNKIELDIASNIFQKYEDPTLKRGIVSRKTSVSLFESDDIQTIDDITVWDGADVYDDEKEKEDE